MTITPFSFAKIIDLISCISLEIIPFISDSLSVLNKIFVKLDNNINRIDKVK